MSNSLALSLRPDTHTHNEMILSRTPATFGELAEHYRAKELSHKNYDRKAYSTQETYTAMVDNWILPRWSNYPLNRILAVDVEEWLATINRARNTKAKIRNVMSAVCAHAVRHGWTFLNPIKGVRQSAKPLREKQPLDVEELQKLYAALELRERTLLALDVPTGLRVGELLALQWADVDFDSRIVDIKKSIWRQHLGPVKTEESEKRMPLSDDMITDLLAWRVATPYKRPADRVFASHKMQGRQPYWPDGLMKNIRSMARRVGITKPLTWHVFRHTFSTLLVQNGENIKTVQSLMRHANVKVTLDIYTHASGEQKRTAQARVAGMFIAKPAANCQPVTDGTWALWVPLGVRRA